MNNTVGIAIGDAHVSQNSLEQGGEDRDDDKNSEVISSETFCSQIPGLIKWRTRYHRRKLVHFEAPPICCRPTLAITDTDCNGSLSLNEIRKRLNLVGYPTHHGMLPVPLMGGHSVWQNARNKLIAPALGIRVVFACDC